jgi:adenosylcobinamide-GDP ribazoletransferase
MRRALAFLRHELRLAFVALQFLTRVPVPAWVGYDGAWLNQSARHFPLVGTGIGAVGALVAVAAHALWPAWIAATLAVAATVWLTVAFHEDGLADTFDALLGAAPRDKALAIMKDSRIGSYGACALVLALPLRVALLAAALERGAAFAACALVASHAVARAGAVVLMARLPYGGDEDHAKAKPLARDVAPWRAVVACAWCLPLLALLAAQAGVPRALIVVAAMVVLVPAVGAWLRRRLGGFTGDTLGAAEQFGEALVLLVAVAA